jgi:hypothetical protein
LFIISQRELGLDFKRVIRTLIDGECGRREWDTDYVSANDPLGLLEKYLDNLSDLKESKKRKAGKLLQLSGGLREREVWVKESILEKIWGYLNAKDLLNFALVNKFACREVYRGYQETITKEIMKGMKISPSECLEIKEFKDELSGYLDSKNLEFVNFLFTKEFMEDRKSIDKFREARKEKSLKKLLSIDPIRRSFILAVILKHKHRILPFLNLMVGEMLDDIRAAVYVIYLSPSNIDKLMMIPKMLIKLVDDLSKDIPYFQLRATIDGIRSLSEVQNLKNQLNSALSNDYLSKLDDIINKLKEVAEAKENAILTICDITSEKASSTMQ